MLCFYRCVLPSCAPLRAFDPGCAKNEQIPFQKNEVTSHGWGVTSGRMPCLLHGEVEIAVRVGLIRKGKAPPSFWITLEPLFLHFCPQNIAVIAHGLIK